MWNVILMVSIVVGLVAFAGLATYGITTRGRRPAPRPVGSAPLRLPDGGPDEDTAPLPRELPLRPAAPRVPRWRPPNTRAW